jgi:hypothetical protein
MVEAGKGRIIVPPGQRTCKYGFGVNAVPPKFAEAIGSAIKARAQIA